MPSLPSTFDDLLQQAQDPLLGHLIRLTGSLHAAQDLLQSANATAIAKKNSFSPGTNFVAWLRQIAVNHFRNHARKESAARSVSLIDEDLHELVEQRYRLRQREEQQTHDWNRVEHCLQKLPDHQREVITQFYLHGHTLVQLAGMTGSKPNAVGQKLHRARLAMVRCVKQITDDVDTNDEGSPAKLTSSQLPTQ